MKARFVGVLLAAMVLLLAGCAGTDGPNAPVELPEAACVDRMFAADGALYSVRHAGGYAYINTENSDEPVCYRLGAVPNGNGSDALWHEASGRLYYSEDYSVYSCDLTGNDRTLIWTLPKKSKEDRVWIEAAAGDRLLVHGIYWWAGTYPNGDYFSLDIGTGEAVKVLPDVSYQFQPAVLCSHGNAVLLVQRNGRNVRVLHIDLLTGESRELGTFDEERLIRHADGVVLEDTVYFVCDDAGVYAVPLSGGEVEARWPDISQAPGMDRLISIEESDGRIYLVMQDGADYPPKALGEWDRETGALIPVELADNRISETTLFIHDGTYYLYFPYIVSGKLTD